MEEIELDSVNILAIDIGGTKTMVGLVDDRGEIALHRSFATNTEDANKHVAHCLQEAEALLVQADLRAAQLQGIGIAVPGMADTRNGVLIHAPFSGWRNIPFRDMVQARYPGIRVEIANDVNACALAEMKYGGAQGLQHFVWVTISTGIGAGIVANGRILEGGAQIAGELGHVVVEWENGRLCGCGNKGCLEVQASGKAIEYELREANPDRQPAWTAEAAAQAVGIGDEQALATYQRAGMYLGRGLSCAVNLLNPQAVFIGGGVSRSFHLLEYSMSVALRSAVIGESNRVLPVRVTSLGYHAALVGASALIAQIR